MPNIQKAEEEIKILQAKIELLKEIVTTSNWDVVSWDAFKRGYEAGQSNREDKDADQIANNADVTDCFIGGNPPNRCNSWRSWYELFRSNGAKEFQPTPQSPEETAEGLREAMRKARMDGVFVVDEPEYYDEIEHDIKDNPKTLLQIIGEWCDDDSQPTCEELVDRISRWLPISYESQGDFGEGWNECLNQIGDNLK